MRNSQQEPNFRSVIRGRADEVKDRLIQIQPT